MPAEAATTLQGNMRVPTRSSSLWQMASSPPEPFREPITSNEAAGSPHLWGDWEERIADLRALASTDQRVRGALRRHLAKADEFLLLPSNGHLLKVAPLLCRDTARREAVRHVLCSAELIGGYGNDLPPMPSREAVRSGRDIGEVFFGDFPRPGAAVPPRRSIMREWQPMYAFFYILMLAKRATTLSLVQPKSFGMPELKVNQSVRVIESYLDPILRYGKTTLLPELTAVSVQMTANAARTQEEDFLPLVMYMMRSWPMLRRAQLEYGAADLPRAKTLPPIKELMLELRQSPRCGRQEKTLLNQAVGLQTLVVFGGNDWHPQLQNMATRVPLEIRDTLEVLHLHRCRLPEADELREMRDMGRLREVVLYDPLPTPTSRAHREYWPNVQSADKDELLLWLDARRHDASLLAVHNLLRGIQCLGCCYAVDFDPFVSSLIPLGDASAKLGE